MELPSNSYDSTEWLGVVEIVNKVQEGFYRANATTLVFGVYLSAVVVILKYFFREEIINASLITILLLLLGTLATLYVISFLFGYSQIGGVSYSSIGSLIIAPSVGAIGTNVTANTDYAGTLDFERGDTPGSFVFDQMKGRIAIDKNGISGIITLPWKELLSLKSVSMQEIQLQRIHKEFGIRIGTRAITLHFINEGDAKEFLSQSSTYSNLGLTR